MTVKEATNIFVGRFSKRDILEFYPSLNLSSIEGSLRKLVQDKVLICGGKGKATYYIRVI